MSKKELDEELIKKLKELTDEEKIKALQKFISLLHEEGLYILKP